jgi:hypothetical protein
MKAVDFDTMCTCSGQAIIFTCHLDGHAATRDGVGCDQHFAKQPPSAPLKHFQDHSIAWTRVSTNVTSHAYRSRIVSSLSRILLFIHMSSTSTNLLGVTVYFDSG